MNRVAEVNRELRLRGVSEKLTAGKGYYYFRDGDVANWRASSVYVYRAADLTVAQWLGEWESLSGRKLPVRAAAPLRSQYIPLLRPAGFATLPQGLDWAYVEAPSYVTKRPDLPRSLHPHGVIECRTLTADECERFDLREVA